MGEKVFLYGPLIIFSPTTIRYGRVWHCDTNYVLYCGIRLFQSYAPPVKKQYENNFFFLKRKYEKKFMFADKIKIIKRELLLPPHYNFHCHFWKSVKRKEKMSNFRSSLGCGITHKWENIYGGVWLVFSNNYFQFLNNILRILTHFFTHTYFHKCF